jgi:hypothetical protein
MSKQVRSARGQVVDFDLLRIKQQISSAPKATTVQAREDFIDRKFKRRIKRLSRDASKSVVLDPNQTVPDADDEVAE